MKNFLAVERGYFDRVLYPSLVETQQIISPITKTYLIAGRRVRIHFYGETVAHIYSLALTHHPLLDNSDADLTIYAWDGTTIGRHMMAPWDESTFEKNYTPHQVSFFGVYVGGEESLSFYDEETKTGYFWTNDASVLPDWVTGAPFRTILHWFLNESNIHLMHGAVVGTNDSSVLLTAKSGSGKSTTALSCLLSGMNYLADDYIAIEGLDKSVTAHSLYHSAKVTKHGLTLFPELHEHVWNKNFDEREKAIMFINDVFPHQTKRTANLNAVLIPKISSGPTRLVPATKIQALVAIAPTTLLQLPLAETDKIQAFKNIIEKIPCYFLELGPEIREIPDVIKSFLNNGTLE